MLKLLSFKLVSVKKKPLQKKKKVAFNLHIYYTLSLNISFKVITNFKCFNSIKSYLLFFGGIYSIV